MTEESCPRERFDASGDSSVKPDCGDADTGAVVGTQLKHLTAVMSLRGWRWSLGYSAWLWRCRCGAASTSRVLHRLPIYAACGLTPLLVSKPDSHSPTPALNQEVRLTRAATPSLAT
jgi:hypothetical protein